MVEMVGKGFAWLDTETRTLRQASEYIELIEKDKALHWV